MKIAFLLSIIIIVTGYTIYFSIGLVYPIDEELPLHLTKNITNAQNVGQTVIIETPYKWSLFCELINNYPYYDCPEWYDGYFDASGSMWVMIEMDQLIIDDPTGESVLGYAVFGGYEELKKDGEFGLCGRFPELNLTLKDGYEICGSNYIAIGNSPSDNCYTPYPCMTVSEHELKHLICECDWHQGLKQKYSFRIVI